MSRVTTTDLLAQAPTGMLAVKFAGEPWVMRGLYNPLAAQLLPQRTRRITEEDQRRRNRPITTEYEEAQICSSLCSSVPSVVKPALDVIETACDMHDRG